MMNLQVFKTNLIGTLKDATETDKVSVGMIASTAAVAGLLYEKSERQSALVALERVGLDTGIHPNIINEHLRWASRFAEIFGETCRDDFSAAVHVVTDQLLAPDYNELKTFVVSDLQGAVDALAHLVNEGGRHYAFDREIAHRIQADFFGLKKKFTDLHLPLLAMIGRPENIVPMQTATKKTNGVGIDVIGD